MTDLLPCPFCGGEPLTHDDFGIVFAQCSDEMCIANHGEFCGVESKAWNTRHVLRATDGLLASMALRYRHDFGILPADEQKTIMAIMRQIHEEVVGKGFYSAKDEDKFKRALNYE